MMIYLFICQVVREKHDRDNYRKLKKTIVHKLHNQQKQRRKCHILEVIKESAVSLLAVGMPSMPSAINTPAVSSEALPQTDEETIEASVMARTTILGLKRTRTISGGSFNSSIGSRGRSRFRTASSSSCYSTLSSRSAGNYRRHMYQLSGSRSVDVRNTLSDNCLRIPDITTAEVYSIGRKHHSASASVEEEEEPADSLDDAAINRCRRPRLHKTTDGRCIEYPTRLILDAKGQKLTTRSRSAITADEVDLEDGLTDNHVVDIDTEVWCDSTQTTPTDPFIPNTNNHNDLLKPNSRTIDLLSPDVHTKRDAKSLRQSFRQHKKTVLRQPTLEISCL